MTIQEAIEKSIEGGWELKYGFDHLDEQGWESDRFHYWTNTYVPERITKFYSDSFYDRLFWQSLGKAMGWEEEGIKFLRELNGNTNKYLSLDKMTAAE